MQHRYLSCVLFFLPLFLCACDVRHEAAPLSDTAVVDGAGKTQGERIQTEAWHFSGKTMGTSYSVKAFVPNHQEVLLTQEWLAQRINERLERVNALMSTYREESELSRFNQADVGKPYAISPETYTVLTLSKHVSALSEGRFDVTVGPLVELWGFGRRGRIETPPSDAEIATQLQYVGFDAVSVSQCTGSGDTAPECVTSAAQSTSYWLEKRKPITIDLSAVAKGFGVDQVAHLLREVGITHFMVEVGGEVSTSGTKANGEPWRIALEAPTADKRSVQRVLELQNVAVATSGDYRNFFEFDGQRYSHTINPRTGRPVTHNLVSVTVIVPATPRAQIIEEGVNREIAKDTVELPLNVETDAVDWASQAAWADAWATALLMAGPVDGPKLAEKTHLAAIFIVRNTSGYTETMTPLARTYVK